MKMPFAVFDFHMHSCWSYDAVTPVEYYFAKAEELGLTHIALTEHHHMDSIGDVLTAAGKHPAVGYIPAAELTVWCELGAYDMVCLGLPVTPTEKLRKVFDAYHQWQRDFGDACCASLTDAGFLYTREDRLKLLRRYRQEHIIQLQGITHVQGELQRDYLINEKHYFVDHAALGTALWTHPLPHYPSADDVLPAVRTAGAKIFIAHPTEYFKRNDVKLMDQLRERLNLDGIECAHTNIPAELSHFYREYCVKHKLLSTAGTDCHSTPETPQPFRFGSNCRFAIHAGTPKWRDEILEQVESFHGSQTAS